MATPASPAAPRATSTSTAVQAVRQQVAPPVARVVTSFGKQAPGVRERLSRWRQAGSAVTPMWRVELGAGQERTIEMTLEVQDV